MALRPWRSQLSRTAIPMNVFSAPSSPCSQNTFDPLHTIVHSTSWRYEAEHDRLLLTYLALLPQGTWLEQWLTVDQISVEPIAGSTLQGDQHLPPGQITCPAVLAHALDHLASLYSSDQSIQATLEAARATPSPKEVVLQEIN